MKNVIIIGILIFLILLAMVAYFILLKHPQLLMTEEQIVELCQQINDSPNGLHVDIDSKKVEIIAANPVKGKPRYDLTFHQGKLEFNFEILKEKFPTIPSFTLPITCQKMVMRYGPLDKHLALLNATSIESSIDLAQLLKNFEKDSANMDENNADISFHIASIDFGGYDISPVLDEKPEDIKALFIQLSELNPDITNRIKKAMVNIEFSDKKGSGSLKIEAESINSHQQIDSAFIKAFFGPPDKEIDLAVLSEPNTSEQLIDASIEGLTLSGKLPDKSNFDASLGMYKLLCKLTPISDTDMFIAYAEYTLKALDLSINNSNIERKKLDNIETWSKMKELVLTASVNNLSIKLIETYFEMLQASQSQMLQGTTDDQAAQKTAEYVQRLQKEFLQSQPTISFSIAPLHHEFFKADAKGSFSIDPNGKPEGSAAVTLYDQAQFEQFIQSSSFFEDKKKEQIIGVMKSIFITDDKGNAQLTFEAKSDPPQMLLNGSSIKFSN